MTKIVFLCGARDFHAMDWFRSAKKKVGAENVAVMADIISAEGLESLLQEEDELIPLIVLDRFLFKKSSRLANIWRNLLKLIILPIQAKLVKKYYHSHPDSVFHAHGMYYMRMASMAKVPYVGTPQGSEVLVRPYRSRMYKSFARKALQAAKAVTVDSVGMKKGVDAISGVDAHIVQFGIDIKRIIQYNKTVIEKRNLMLSVRGMTQLYQESLLLRSRNLSCIFNKEPITFTYPFFDAPYLEEVKKLAIQDDCFLGRIKKDDLYELMGKTQIVFSIPKSDSSPRSVYESIFMGGIVIISQNDYYNLLPSCMQERIVIADLSKPDWFDEAVNQAKQKALYPFEASEDAISMFDQENCFDKVYTLLMK